MTALLAILLLVTGIIQGYALARVVHQRDMSEANLHMLLEGPLPIKRDDKIVMWIISDREYWEYQKLKEGQQ